MVGLVLENWFWILLIYSCRYSSVGITGHLVLLFRAGKHGKSHAPVLHYTEVYGQFLPKVQLGQKLWGSKGYPKRKKPEHAQKLCDIFASWAV